VDIEVDPGADPVPNAEARALTRPFEPVDVRCGRPGSGPGPRLWHRLGNRLNFRIENLGRGASITGVRLSPLPMGALVDWNKALPATLSFEGAALAVAGPTRRSILDMLASVRIALPRSEAEHAELVLEIVMRIDGAETTAVTTVALSDSAR
jgi:hypothetical protein